MEYVIWHARLKYDNMLRIGDYILCVLVDK